MNGVGFHLPGMFDRILDLDHCYLQQEPSNQIRLAIRDFALQNDISFYDVRAHTGLLRNLIIRTDGSNQLMVILVVSENNSLIMDQLLPYIAETFPSIDSLMYVINPKKNDQISDLKVELFKGNPFLNKSMKSPAGDFPDLKFRVGPISFYQTNTLQAEVLYKTAFDLADFKGYERVFDLYSGTGTIALYVARSVASVLGIEYVEEAVKDAKTNAELNGIDNVEFIAGDMAKVLNDALLLEKGIPDVIITDPPRAGMHPAVVEQLIKIKAAKIVYVSCNPATQARDIALLSEHYDVSAVQPVDMFPQTHHVENVTLLVLKINAKSEQ